MFQHELKNAYIWQWPYEYSYDFLAAWSLAQIKSDWRTFPNHESFEVDSSHWLHKTNNTDASMVKANFMNLAWATKVTVIEKFYANWAAWWGYQTYRLRNSANNENEWWADYRANTSSGYWGFWLSIPTASTTFNTSSLSAWDYTWEVVFDLVNLTAVGKLTWKTDITWTLTSWDVDRIRKTAWFQFAFSGTWNYVQSIYLKAEF